MSSQIAELSLDLMLLPHERNDIVNVNVLLGQLVGLSRGNAGLTLKNLDLVFKHDYCYL